MGRIGCALIVLFGFLIWAGSQKILTGLRNRTPTTVSMAEYAKSRPSAHWLKLTGCRLSIANAMHFERNGTMIQEIFVPVVPDVPGPASPSCVLLATKNQDLLWLYGQMGTVQTQEQAIAFLQANKDKLHRDIEGLVRYGIDLEDKDRRELAKVGSGLTRDFIILDDGEKPSMALGIVMLAGAAAMGLVAVVFILHNRSPKKPVA